MGRILILEPDPELLQLFRHVVERLDHDPVVASSFPDDSPPPVDVILLEPASPACMRVAHAVRAGQPDVPVVCASIEQSGGEAASLDPVKHLTKPFSMADLEHALRAAIGPARAVPAHSVAR